MQDWQYYVVHFTMYYGIWIGYTTFRIDFKRRRLTVSKILNVVVIIGSVVFMSAVPRAVKINLSHIQLNVKNPLIGYAIALTIFIRVMFLVVVIVMRGKRDGQLENWFKKLWLMQTSYFDRFKNVPSDTSLRKWLAVTVFIMLLHGVTLLLNLWEMYLRGKYWRFFDIYVLCGIINFQHFALWHHEVLLCYLHECYSKLNYQLENFEMDPKLSLIYFQVTQLLKELNDIYSPVVVWIQLCLIVTNSIVGYVLILYFSSANVELDAYAYILGGRLYILLCVHNYLYFMLCDRTIKKSRKTSFILKSYNNRDESSEIEVISLNLLLSKVRISIKGMFNIDLSCYFSIIAQTLLLTIVLVQVELQNKATHAN